MKKITIILIIILVAISCLNFFNLKGSETVLNNNNDNQSLIRFHVLANSDSPEDQLLKLKVRDRIMHEMADAFDDVVSIDDSRDVIIGNIDRIQEIAVAELLKNNADYKVEVVLGQHTFPTRRYGNMVFAAGDYEALRVIIGDGKGQNWWCVMFPPLCFIDVKNGLIDEGTKKELRSVLSEDEYQLVSTSVNQKQLPIQLRSKLVDFIKNSKNQISRMALNF